jgi:enoyl-CoA hydratase/carnithine racemase
MFTAEWIDADRAVEIGMAARKLPDNEVLPATLEKAREIAQWPISSLVAIKKTMNAAHSDAIKNALEIEHAEMKRLVGSPENVEAIQAFMQKRAPDFRQFRK